MLKSTFHPIFANVPFTPRKLVQALPHLLTQSSPSARGNASPGTTSTIPQSQLPPTAAYIHLPFCRKRCHYCDFPIVALGTSSSNPDDDPRVLNYIQLVCQEIKATHVKLDTNPPLETVYFGGGTPSLVPPGLVSLVFEALRRKFGLSLDAEISMEMDPGTFVAEKLKEMLGLGVNRVSLGVQAFQEELLRVCGRAHGVGEVYQAIEILRFCGVENWSLDLISSLPHQTEEMWEESLRLVIEAQPKHVSIYDLQLEQGTKFGALYKPGEFPLPSENLSADFFRIASSTMSSAGYNHYEISSYCKSRFECKHNLTYWENRPFYAFGLGSASHVGGVRFSRPKKMKDYVNYVRRLENSVSDICENNDLDGKDRAMDVVMLSLRTARGLDLKCFGEEFGWSLVLSLCEAYRPYLESGHVLFLDEQRNVIGGDDFCSLLLLGEQNIQEKFAFIRLSDPDGFLLSNELISTAFAVVDSSTR